MALNLIQLLTEISNRNKQKKYIFLGIRTRWVCKADFIDICEPTV
jgi:hypothetical protein